MKDGCVLLWTLSLGAFGFGCGAGGSGGAGNRFSEDDPPHCRPVSAVPKAGPSGGNYLMVDFTNPAHRATLTEDGLEHVMTDGPWAIYQVTSDQPRIYIPGSIAPDQSRFGIQNVGLCISQGYFTDIEAQPLPTNHTKVKFMGVVGDGSEPEALVVRSAAEYAFDNWPYNSCRGGTDLRTRTPANEPVTDMYLELEPAPPVGSLVPLMMVAIGSYDSDLEMPHMNENVQICCPNENECSSEYPPGWEPPDPSDPPGGGDGGTEPPDPPDGGGGEPPGSSLPPCPPTSQEPPGQVTVE